ncbi:MAG: ACT domain-containing protein [Nitrospirota bacterium]
MAKALTLKQLNFVMPDRPGLLSAIMAALTGAKVNITSICAYGIEGKAYFMLVTDSNAKAKKALAPLGAAFTTEHEGVFGVNMPNKPGELQKVATIIADAGININYMYGTTSSVKTSTCIFSTSDDKKAIKAINR